MKQITEPADMCNHPTYLEIGATTPTPFHLKYEAFNFAGSIKLTPAKRMLQTAADAGLLDTNTVLIESSSGNLGIALAMLAAANDLKFTCVTDPNCNEAARAVMLAYGADVITVETPDANGSYLSARKQAVVTLCDSSETYLWLNQYSNKSNWESHYAATAPAVHEAFPKLRRLYIGTGTGGTLLGCIKYFADNAPKVEIIAVDSEGSVNFGGTPGKRRLPGLGSSEAMPFVQESKPSRVIFAAEIDAIRQCHRLARTGLLVGASTGVVVSAAISDLRSQGRSHTIRSEETVAISPDDGGRYLQTVYSESWLMDKFGVSSNELIGTSK